MADLYEEKVLDEYKGIPTRVEGDGVTVYRFL
jgi:hypothetical protein